VEENFQRRFSVNLWCDIFGDLNLWDFFIFIQNFRDNVYLTPPGTQKELRKKIVRVCQEKPPHFLLNAKLGISRRYR
jgi:hypothetical protein